MTSKYTTKYEWYNFVCKFYRRCNLVRTHEDTYYFITELFHRQLSRNSHPHKLAKGKVLNKLWLCKYYYACYPFGTHFLQMFYASTY